MPFAIRRPSSWSLRVRLVAALLALLATASIAVGSAGVVVMQRLLEGRVDAQLASATARTDRGFPRGQPRGQLPDGEAEDGCSPALLQGGQAEGTLTTRRTPAGVECGAVITGSSDLVDLMPAAMTALRSVAPDDRPHSVDVPAQGDYRVVSRRMPDGDVVVVGLPLAAARSAVYQLAAVIALATLLALVLAGIAGAFIVRRALRPLRRVAGTAARVAELPLDRGEVALAERVAVVDTDVRTEVGQVGAALNQLLDHVGSALEARQRSETRVRQFVADASHELRTPLSAIRGYAELTRRSPQSVPGDVAHALRRVESEAVRMTHLVDDLLLLARLDAGRPVESEPVDLSRLLVDAVSDAHAAGPDHSWQLEVAGEPVVVCGDGARLHQVVANLLANARTHTPAGTSVTVSVRPDGRLAVLRVLDDGPGIPAELADDVFERFARGDSSRSRAHGSTGLGLAIVAAVVEAHGGSVEVGSAPGRTAFSVRLPLAEEPAAARTVVDGGTAKMGVHPPEDAACAPLP